MLQAYCRIFLTDEEVREGLVESKEQSKKGGLEQEKYT